jgi:hypothetical protein
VSDGSGVSRGDRNRNARLARLREAVPVTNAIVGIDPADSKQMVVVTDHESRVLARRVFRRRAWELGVALDWAAARAAAGAQRALTTNPDHTRIRHCCPAAGWPDFAIQRCITMKDDASR